ncbi:MAG: hypothetical protein OXM61_07120 [Candidatus Poribacteria bacterium]|nr:hypothetical protein [Candidatus Poribacteria bacterium]
MRNSLVVLGLVLAYLLSIFLVSCGGDEKEELNPADKLAGTYTLIEIKVRNVGTTIIVRVPDISGTLYFDPDGPWSMSMVASEIGLNQEISGTRWSADQTTITSGNADQTTDTNYALDGERLTFSLTMDDLQVDTTWQKL